MGIVTGHDAVDSIKARKRFGRPNGYGLAVYGFSHYGRDDERCGIYQQRHCKIGKMTVHEKYYWPSNPQTEAQQANRGKFADAVAGWQDLTDEEKEEYRIRADGYQLSGYNLYLREYMHS